MSSAINRPNYVQEVNYSSCEFGQDNEQERHYSTSTSRYYADSSVSGESAAYHQQHHHQQQQQQQQQHQQSHYQNHRQEIGYTDQHAQRFEVNSHQQQQVNRHNRQQSASSVDLISHLANDSSQLPAFENLQQMDEMNSSGNNSTHQVQQQSEAFSMLAPMSTAIHRLNHVQEVDYSCEFSHDNEPERLYSTSTLSYYPDSSVCNEPSTTTTYNQQQHHHQNQHQQQPHYHNHQQDSGYSNHVHRFEVNNQQQQQQQVNSHIRQQSSRIDLISHQTSDGSRLPAFEHLQQMEQMQSYRNDTDQSQMKQYHNEHQSLYYTSISSHVPIDHQQQQQEQRHDYKLPSVIGAQSLSMTQYEHSTDNHQYPSSNLMTKTQDNFAPQSLQQLTLNCDNHANQVTTTTLTTERTTQAPSKGRSLKGRRGRPRKKGLRSKNKVNGKLWEFIRDLLLNDRTNPSFIRWERREDGVFKFVQSDKVAKMWGERKQNPKMTYEKLSRAMRYYYKSKVLLPVFGRRLVYKFGPNATGWLPDGGNSTY